MPVTPWNKPMFPGDLWRDNEISTAAKSFVEIISAVIKERENVCLIERTNDQL